MKESETVTAVVAIYGAVVSTIVAAMQFARERVSVRMTVRKNRQVVGDPRYTSTVLTELTVTNVGRRPVTITTFGTVPLHPNRIGLVAAETQPRLPCQIAEGQYIESFWPQADLDFSTIDYWVAWDSNGRAYRLREASRIKHWRSVLQMKRAFKRRKHER